MTEAWQITHWSLTNQSLLYFTTISLGKGYKNVNKHWAHKSLKKERNKWLWPFCCFKVLPRSTKNIIPLWLRHVDSCAWKSALSFYLSAFETQMWNLSWAAWKNQTCSSFVWASWGISEAVSHDMTWDKMIKCHALPFSHSDIVQSEPSIVHLHFFSLSLSYHAMVVALSTHLPSKWLWVLLPVW